MKTCFRNRFIFSLWIAAIMGSPVEGSLPRDALEVSYLQAIREGNALAVSKCLSQPQLDLNAQDGEGNTDLMLAIKGSKRNGSWGVYEKIFNSIVQRSNRNWNLQNQKGQTALFLAIGYERGQCFERLLEEEEVDPNISNVDNATPLLVAIATKQFPIAIDLINCPRVNVLQRGTDDVLPLTIAHHIPFSKGKVWLIHSLCQRILLDCNAATDNLIKKVLLIIINSFPDCEAGPMNETLAKEILEELLDLSVRTNVELLEDIDEIFAKRWGDSSKLLMQVSPKTLQYFTYLMCSLKLPNPPLRINHDMALPNQFANAVRGKILFLLNPENFDASALYLEGGGGLSIADWLRILEQNVRLISSFLAEQSEANAEKFSQNLEDYFWILRN